MTSQSTLTATLYVYECPAGCHRYWDEDAHLDPNDDGSGLRLYCESCGRACHSVDSFEFDPFSMSGFPEGST